MKCKDAARLFQDYAEGRLFGLERKAFEEHVEKCAVCSDELKAHGTLFELLNGLETDSPPVWFEETVVRRLKLEGVIFEPKVPLLKRMAVAFGRIPNIVKYPLVALLSAVAIYIPVHLLLSFMKGFAGKVAVIGSESLVAAERTLEDISVLSRFFDIIARDFRALKTILGAFFSLLSSAGGIVLPVLGFFILMTIILVRYIRNPHRRSHNAPYGF